MQGKAPDYKAEAEKENVELKTCSLGRLQDDLWETVSAFSNMEGGTLYLGVKPDGTPEGLTHEEIDKVQRDMLSLCMSAFNHEIYPQISVHGNVVAAYIPPAPAAMRPIFRTRSGNPQTGGRVRIGASNVRVTSEWIQRFAIASRGGAELVPVPSVFTEVFAQEFIGEYLDKLQTKRGDVYANYSQSEILRKTRAIIDEHTVTYFGLLAFGNDYTPQELIGPTTNVAVTHYAGESKVNEEDASENSLDDREFSGNVLRQFDASFKFILSKLPVRSRIDDNGKRVEYFAIPQVAIREALANAIAHRDYSTTTSRIQVDIYSDRVEFTNPGRSLVPIEQLDTAHSETRNPILMNYLKDMGVTEQRARGIRTIKTSLRQAGLLEPKFEHRGNSFVATLYSSAIVADDDKVWLRRFDGLKLTDHQKNGLVLARHEPTGINNSEYRDINHMSNVRDDIRAKRDLQRLVSIGLLEPLGENKYRRYVLGERATR